MKKITKEVSKEYKLGYKNGKSVGRALLISDIEDWAKYESSDTEIPLGELLTYLETLK